MAIGSLEEQEQREHRPQRLASRSVGVDGATQGGSIRSRSFFRGGGGFRPSYFASRLATKDCARELMTSAWWNVLPRSCAMNADDAGWTWMSTQPSSSQNGSTSPADAVFSRTRRA